MSIIWLTRNSPDPDKRIREIRQQAWNWIIRLDSKQMSSIEKETLSHWLARSDDHQRLYHEAESLWRTLDKLPELKHKLPLLDKYRR